MAVAQLRPPLPSKTDLARRDAVPAAVVPPRPTLARRFRRLLRGRVHWAILLAILGIADGGVACYWLAPPIYRAVATVRVEPQLPANTKDDQSRLLAEFDTFVDTQASLLRSPSVTEQAATAVGWNALKRRLSVGDDSLTRHVRVVRPDNTRGLIEVWFDHADPAVAQHGVQAVTAAYDQQFMQPDLRSGQTNRAALESRRDALKRDLDAVQKNIASLGAEYGTDDLASMYQFKLAQANKIEASLQEVQVALARAQGETATEPAATMPAIGSAPIAPVEASPALEVALDAPATQPAAEEAAKESQIIGLPDWMVPGHAAAAAQRDAVINQARAAELNEERRTLEARAAALVEERKAREARTQELAEERKAHEAYAATLTQQRQVSEATRARRLDDLTQAQTQLQTLYDKARKDATAVGERNLQIQALQPEASRLRMQLVEANEELAGLDAHAAVSGRVAILPAVLPSGPQQDQRLQYTLAGALGGGLLGLGFVMLLGAFDHRVDRTDDLADVMFGVPVLGVVPAIPAGAKPQDAQSAAAALHRVRAILQGIAATNGNGSGGEGRKAFAITAPTAGSGKTSVAVALGVSLAQSGTRTLLIDCDLSGGGLRARLNAMGVDTHSLARSSTPLENGATQTPTDFDHALDELLAGLNEKAAGPGPANPHNLPAREGDGTDGLAAYLDGAPLSRCIRPTHVPGLDILTSITAGREHLAKLSPARIRAMIDEARADYDMVLVDTGPVPGSVEGLSAAAAVDGVIVTVARHEDEATAREAIARLRTINSPVLGVVFNKARAKDVPAATTPSGTRTRRGGKRARGVDDEQIEGSGLLAMTLTPPAPESSGTAS